MQEPLKEAGGTSISPSVGDMAPEFTLPSLEHGKVGPQQYRGEKKLVIAFYPKDNTSG